MRSDSSVRWRFVIAMVAAGVIAVSVVAVAQTENVERFTATTVNMQPEGEALRFNVLRWLSEADRGDVLAHLRDADGPEADAAEDLPAVGFIWPSSSGVGYALVYAHRGAAQDGGEHITVVTRRPLGLPGPEPWQAIGGARSLTADDFTVIELRLNSSGHGEGKMSLATDVTFEGGEHRLAGALRRRACEDVTRQPGRRTAVPVAVRLVPRLCDHVGQ